MHSLTELEANDWPGWWSQQINVALHMRGSAYLITGCSMHFQASKHTFTWCWIVFDEFVDVEGTLYGIAYRSLLDCLLQLCIVFASKLARSHFDSSSELSDFNFVMANAMKKALLEGDMPRESSRSPKLGIRIPIMPPRMDPPQPASCSDEDWKGCMQRWRANGELPSWIPTGSKQTFRNQDAGSSATELEPHNENSVAHYPIAEQDGIWECSCGTWNPDGTSCMLMQPWKGRQSSAGSAISSTQAACADDLTAVNEDANTHFQATQQALVKSCLNLSLTLRSELVIG